MRLSKPGISVDKKWIVDLTGSLAYCVSSSSGELIRFAYYKEVKSVTLTERRRAGTVLGEYYLCDNGGRRDEKVHLRTLLPLLVDAENHIHRISEDYWTEARQ